MCSSFCLNIFFLCYTCNDFVTNKCCKYILIAFFRLLFPFFLTPFKSQFPRSPQHFCCCYHNRRGKTSEWLGPSNARFKVCEIVDTLSNSNEIECYSKINMCDHFSCHLHRLTHRTNAEMLESQHKLLKLLRTWNLTCN